ncbi:hypothetical protein [Saccharomonospora azurea]|uniref:DUF3137 domain-containing protein n=1 Tax=Saccharomonospora azurea NA-128 TaxID=882081 RepID=H8GB47_9PSEU|nr:hypothetical protein [Saccharomonospora azurea]EHY90670.1 hypothetical protein SacazDRAFT_03810 [Saccharomonospora azurea NA-128]
MSTGLIVAIAVGGGVLFLGGVAWLISKLTRSFAAESGAATAEAGDVRQRLAEELQRRGWKFEERNDSYAEIHNAQPEFQLRNVLDPFTLPPKAVGARNVITGTHRSRPFIATEFDVRHQGQHVPVTAVWLSLPAMRPGLTVRRVLRAQSKIRSQIGQRDIQLGFPEFDENFEITTEDEAFARAVLVPDLVRFLVTDPRASRGFAIYGDQLNAHDIVGDHRDPQKLVPALDLRCDILDRIPTFVWS